MAAKFLGQFLLERGSITSTQLLAALEAQRATNPLLGELAVHHGMLTAAQARRINERQRAEDRRFGDIAREMGLLDAAQLDVLLAAQKSGRKLFGEILVEQGALSRERLEAELAAHRQDLDEANHALALGIAGHALADTVTSAIRVCNRLFPRLLDSQCQAAGIADAATLAGCEVTAHVRIEAAHPLLVGIGCARATLQSMACAFLSIAPEQCDDELALDALGELVNVLMGYVVRDTLPDDASYRAHPPSTALTAADLAATGNTLALTMNSQRGAFVLVVG
ncbi:chemotaxis protein CheX [Pseudoxanthomonas putridarboris]|uniref:Chemotaxis protein CheX n=1 Tax=Pseudoxanthomonas putridarboris TaxID=752605 RepID=A0ABU9J2V2_9GAMM